MTAGAAFLEVGGWGDDDADGARRRPEEAAEAHNATRRDRCARRAAAAREDWDCVGLAFVVSRGGARFRVGVQRLIPLQK